MRSGGVATVQKPIYLIDLFCGFSRESIKSFIFCAALGLVVFRVGSLLVYLLTDASFEVIPAVILSWVAQSLCRCLAVGAALGFYSAWAPRWRCQPNHPLQM